MRVVLQGSWTAEDIEHGNTAGNVSVGCETYETLLTQVLPDSLPILPQKLASVPKTLFFRDRISPLVPMFWM